MFAVQKIDYKIELIIILTKLWRKWSKIVVCNHHFETDDYVVMAFLYGMLNRLTEKQAHTNIETFFFTFVQCGPAKVLP